MSNKTNIESLTLTINSNVCEMFTHKVVREDALGFEVYVELYRAQDLMKAAGLDKEKAEKTLWHWKQSDPRISGGTSVVMATGAYAVRGTYLTKRDLFKLAAYIDSAFYDAVFDAFEALTEGRYNEAAGIAARVAISPELKVELKESNIALNTAIDLWGKNQEHQRSKGHLYTMFHDHIICQSITGGSLKSLKASSSKPTLAAMMLAGEQTDHVDALLAANKQVTTMLNAGVDYALIKAVVKR